MKVSWKETLSDGHVLQVVYDEKGNTFLELVGEVNLGTDSNEECVRVGPLTQKDQYWINGAVDEAHEKG